MNEQLVQIKFDTGFSFDLFVYPLDITIYASKWVKPGRYFTIGVGVVHKSTTPHIHNSVTTFNKDFLKMAIEYNILTVENDIVLLTNFTKLKILGVES